MIKIYMQIIKIYNAQIKLKEISQNINYEQ